MAALIRPLLGGSLWVAVPHLTTIITPKTREKRTERRKDIHKTSPGVFPPPYLPKAQPASGTGWTRRRPGERPAIPETAREARRSSFLKMAVLIWPRLVRSPWVRTRPRSRASKSIS
ncbi:hypothetical protein ACJRO7_005034 [Eucalyptus globulus]|uniref:Secreted protein n=1 Tax=Eucalyptus globulus TaxID=34317 RepID=A0ABD3J1Y7_EUCGL